MLLKVVNLLHIRIVTMSTPMKWSHRRHFRTLGCEFIKNYIIHNDPAQGTIFNVLLVRLALTLRSALIKQRYDKSHCRGCQVCWKNICHWDKILSFFFHSLNNFRRRGNCVVRTLLSNTMLPSTIPFCGTLGKCLLKAKLV